MTKQILKWTWRPAGSGYFDLDLPNGAEILAIQNQYELLTIWALVSPEEIENPVKRTFEVHHTGDAFEVGKKFDFIAGKKRYLSTVQFKGGDYVLHIFEIIAS